jgi:hypothetical protein
MIALIVGLLMALCAGVCCLLSKKGLFDPGPEPESDPGPWQMPGFLVTCNDKEYRCARYEVISGGSACGGDGILGAGGSAITISNIPLFRIVLYETVWSTCVIHDLVCPVYEIKSVALTTKDKDKKRYLP